MARIANSERIIARNSLNYVEKKIHEVNECLTDAVVEVKKLTNDGSFTAANVTKFKNNKLQAAKDANSDAVSMYRWVLDHFSIAIPTALDDAAVDAIDEDIRTHDDQ